MQVISLYPEQLVLLLLFLLESLSIISALLL
uniref:Uncharacterized protein n=1 Tax=Anguilla anguilla TaxID=7936 RepID=A0A0E9TFQ1_ANGAN